MIFPECFRSSEPPEFLPTLLAAFPTQFGLDWISDLLCWTLWMASFTVSSLELRSGCFGRISCAASVEESSVHSNCRPGILQCTHLPAEPIQPFPRVKNSAQSSAHSATSLTQSQHSFSNFSTRQNIRTSTRNSDAASGA